MNNSFYNIINASGDTLHAFETNAQSQEEIILNFFKEHPVTAYTPATIHKTVLPKAPITSVRRAMTNLTKAYQLEKTDIQGQGDYDKPNYMWRLVRQEPTQSLLF